MMKNSWLDTATQRIAIRAMKAASLHETSQPGGVDFSPMCTNLRELYITLVDVSHAVLIDLLVKLLRHTGSAEEEFIRDLAMTSFEIWQVLYRPDDPHFLIYEELPEQHQLIHRFIAEQAIAIAGPRGN